jgi:hypothetical protein
MKAVSKEAKRVLDILTKDLGADNHYRKVNTSEAFTPVSVDWLGESELGTFFAVAHNSVQNGDLMADPDMEFLKSKVDGNYYPIRYQNDYLPGFLGRTVAIIIKGGKITGHYPKAVRDLCAFTTKWMRNIKNQQDLSKVA